jgi:hypothetical protein
MGHAGGYARAVDGALATVVWTERSETDAAVFAASVVKMRILEGKR